MFKKKWLHIVAIVMLLFVLPDQTAQASENKRYIIGFEPEIQEDLLEPFSERIYQRLERIQAVAIELSPTEVHLFEQSEYVSYIEEDEPVKVKSQVVDWGVKAVGSSSVWENGLTGKGVKVAILDTGVNANHPDLKVVSGQSFVSYTDSYQDDNGHGTHVAGIIAALNNSIGIVGVAPEASIYAAKVLDENGDGFTSDVVKAIEWSLNQGVNIINLSMGGKTSSRHLEAALDDAYQHGALIIAAAGNQGNASGTGDTVDFPAAYESVIAVAAIDQQNRRASFSATGPAVEVAAPGVAIRSTYLNNEYVQVHGTSMAAPHVTGHLALLKQAYPNATNVQLRQMLREQTVDLGPLGRDPHYGFGRIAIPANLRVIERPLPPSNVAVSSLGWEGDLAQVEMTWSAATTGEKAVEYQIYRNNERLVKTETTTTSYIDEVGEGEYTYTVTAIGEDGQESKKPAGVSIIIQKEKEPVITPSFADMTGDEWYASSIKLLVRQGIIQGYPDGTVRPHQTITRGEAAVMMTRALNEQTAPYSEAFTDVRPQSYTAEYIQAMTNKGIFGGYSDGTFRPNTSIQRGEVATILNRAYQFTPVSHVSFPDVSKDYFAYTDITIVAGANIARGMPDGTFKPRSPVTRAEFASFLTRALAY